MIAFERMNIKLASENQLPQFETHQSGLSANVLAQVLINELAYEDSRLHDAAQSAVEI